MHVCVCPTLHIRPRVGRSQSLVHGTEPWEQPARGAVCACAVCARVLGGLRSPSRGSRRSVTRAGEGEERSRQGARGSVRGSGRWGCEAGGGKGPGPARATPRRRGPLLNPAPSGPSSPHELHGGSRDRGKQTAGEKKRKKLSPVRRPQTRPRRRLAPRKRQKLLTNEWAEAAPEVRVNARPPPAG